MRAGDRVYVVVLRSLPGDRPWQVEARTVHSCQGNHSCFLQDESGKGGFWLLDEIFTVAELAETVARKRNEVSR